MREEMLIESIEQDLRMQKESGRLNLNNLGTEWAGKMLTEPARFIGGDSKLKRQVMGNFRRRRMFFPDVPVGRQNILNPLNLIDGARRGHVRMLKEALKVIEDSGFAGLLERYPCSRVGNPNVFHYRDYRVTLEWLRHVYFLGLFKKYIAPEVGEDFTALDLGGFYGVFSGLMKSEFTRSHCVLVDLPQQLSLAHYYLGLNFPKASIGTYKDIVKSDTISRAFIERYDFVLVPCYFYDKIAKGSADVFTNFMSLQEMGREYFNHYLANEPFLSSRFLLTVNRYQSAPTYDNGVTILDYPLSSFKKIHFATAPIVGERYRRKQLFFYTHFPYASQHFEFIGKRE